MGLTKQKIGNLIELVDERNSLGIRDFYGININKEFMPTVANTDGLDETKYKVVRKNRFVFSGMQTGRDECIRISMYMGKTPIIVSPAYTTFEVTAVNAVIPEYFFMYFLSHERDRLGWFYSDSSIRSNLDWDRFCDIDIELPPVEVQQKYVDIYNAMLANQKAYETGLDDLKLVCDAYIDDLRHRLPKERIGEYIIQSDSRNEQELTVDYVRGLSIAKEIIFTKADMEGVNLSNYKLLPPESVAYVTVTSRNGEKITIALNDSEETYIVSSSYIVFGTRKDKLLPEYLMMYFNRSEFDRYARFNSWGSARETFDWEELCDVKIPIPDVAVQRSISDVYKAYKERQRINECLKAQIKTLCPILLKGAIDEANEVAAI